MSYQFSAFSFEQIYVFLYTLACFWTAYTTTDMLDRNTVTVSVVCYNDNPEFQFLQMLDSHVTNYSLTVLALSHAYDNRMTAFLYFMLSISSCSSYVIDISNITVHVKKGFTDFEKSGNITFCLRHSQPISELIKNKP